MSKPFHVPQVSTGQAYAMLGGAALMMTLAMGIRQNLGLFQAPASRELHALLPAVHAHRAGVSASHSTGSFASTLRRRSSM